MTTTFEGGFKELTPMDNSETTVESHNFHTGEQSVQRHFIGPYANRNAFIEVELLNPDKFPKQHPLWDGLYVSQVDVEGRAVTGQDDDNLATYQRAHITVTYEAIKGNSQKPQQQRNERDDYRLQLSALESSEGGAEYLTVAWVADPNTQNQVGKDQGPFTTLEIQSDIVITHMSLNDPYWLEYQLGYNTVNHTAFVTPSGRIFPKGTLLYLGEAARNRKNVGVTVNGVEVDPLSYWWDITHKFRYNPRGWNSKFINGEWVEVWRGVDDDEKKIPFYWSSNHFHLFFGYQGNPYSDADLEVLNTAYNDILDIIDSNIQLYRGAADNIAGALVPGVGPVATIDPRIVSLRITIVDKLKEMGFGGGG